MTKLRGAANRITAIILSGMLIVGTASGSVFAAETDADPGQMSEVTVEEEEPVEEDVDSSEEEPAEEVEDPSEEEPVEEVEDPSGEEVVEDAEWKYFLDCLTATESIILKRNYR